MNFTKLAAGLAAALSLSFAAGVGQAAVLSLEDDDIDFALNSDLTLKTSGTLTTGDILVSIFEISTLTIDGVDVIPAGQELTGAAAIQITGGDGSLANPYTFAQVTQGLNAILALGTDPDVVVPEGGAGEGATIAMWFNSDVGAANLEVNRAINPASNCDSLADCISDASDAGILFQVDGFAGDLDEFWTSTLSILGGGDIGIVLGTNNALTVATFNAAQTTLFQGGGLTIGGQVIATGDPCVNGAGADGCIVGGVLTGNILGGSGLSNGAFAHSDFDAVKLTAVPEPGTLLLLGAALLGAGALRRRS